MNASQVVDAAGVEVEDIESQNSVGPVQGQDLPIFLGNGKEAQDLPRPSGRYLFGVELGRLGIDGTATSVHRDSFGRMREIPVPPTF